MKYQVTLKSCEVYELEAESEKEAIDTVLYNPMYRPDAVIKEISNENTVDCKQISITLHNRKFFFDFYCF